MQGVFTFVGIVCCIGIVVSILVFAFLMSMDWYENAIQKRVNNELFAKIESSNRVACSGVMCHALNELKKSTKKEELIDHLSRQEITSSAILKEEVRRFNETVSKG